MATLVPMATGDDLPVWPLPGVAKRVPTSGGRSFGARRKSGARRHAGIDIFAPEGALVVAPESGTLVKKYKFNGPRAFALLFQTDTGIVINLGEVEPNSWREFGLEVGESGSWVPGGASVARVGVNPKGSTMLHIETYQYGTRANQRWFPGQDPPRRLLNPTTYMLEAAAVVPDPLPVAESRAGLVALAVGIPVAMLLVVATRPRKVKRR